MVEIRFDCKCGLELNATFVADDETSYVRCIYCERAYVVRRPVVVGIDEAYEHVHND